ncbi:hypothetical protein SH668x_003526 [Planctomicrobium sp. SH668]|uniref:hypothetical protein n=1 Tax=Planctomicrobium sp. SH668 TaxID=3448126 RepID=UPI003F5B959D
MQRFLRPTFLPMFSALLLPIVMVSLTGCTPEDGIRQYTVDKIENTPKTTSAPSPMTLAADAWFFKMTGDPDTVLKQTVAFSNLMNGLRFSMDGRPQYSLPEGWTVTNGPAPRYQTIHIPGTEPALELTVSSLPLQSGRPDAYLLANIDRWRGQIGLAPYNAESWLDDAFDAGELQVNPTDAGVVSIVNLLGEMEGKGPTRILGSIVLRRPQEPAQPMTESENTPEPEIATKQPFTFDVPEGWEKSPGSSLRAASFNAGAGEKKADVSVMRLGGGGDVDSNVNRWRDQVKLGPLESEELKAGLKEIEISGKPATYAEAIGETESILAAIIDEGDAKWFFKMQGPKDIVAAESERFQAFMKSWKFDK